MDLSLPGLIGAVFGLAIGWVDYKMIGGMIRAKWMQKRTEAGLADHPSTEKIGNVIQFVLFISTMILLPIVGYWAGSTLTGS